MPLYMVFLKPHKHGYTFITKIIPIQNDLGVYVLSN